MRHFCLGLLVLTLAQGRRTARPFSLDASLIKELDSKGLAKPQMALKRAIYEFAVDHDVPESLRDALAATRWGSELASKFVLLDDNDDDEDDDDF